MILLLLAALLQDPAAQLAAADVAYRAGNFAEASDLYEKALAGLPEKERTAPLWTVCGHAALQAKRYDLAIRAYTRAIAMRGATAEVHRALGQAQLLSGRSEEAIGSFRRASILDPDGTDLLTLARVRAQRDEWLLAEHEVSVYLRVDPGSIDGLELLGYVLSRQGKSADAAAACRALARRKPGDPKYLTAWAHAESAQRHYGDAADLLEIATRLGPPDADALRLLADLYLQLQMYRESAAAYGRLLASSKAPKADDWLRLGHAYLQSQEPVSAREAFEKARTLDPSLTAATLQLAAMAAARAETELARKEFSAAAAAPGPTGAEALGDFELQAGRFDAAAAAYAEALRRGSTAVGTRSSLVFALQSAGKREEARQALRDALRVAPLDERLRALLRAQ